MMNISETQPPLAASHINAAETVPPVARDPKAQQRVLLAGESVADSYVINSLLNEQGKQADVYLAKRWGKPYVIKVYHNGWTPSDRLKSFLLNVRHPNVAHVVECGKHNGAYYEIYEYYPEGTLESVGALPVTRVQSVLVPSVNEGLHELHQHGIVHCDIKPSNLFFADDGARVVIGDCGISGYTAADGKLTDLVRGTPEYAPPVKALLWNAALSPAYDYGSFGLVLVRAVLGRSLFAGMSIEEIARAWENGLELPSQISGRIGVLIKGLLNVNEEQRWGYQDVKRWCEGEFVRVDAPKTYAPQKKEKPIVPLIFGRIDGKTVSVSTLHQLELAIRQNWTQAVRVVKKRELVEFVRQFDESLTEKIRPLAQLHDGDAAVFRLLMYIQDDPHEIVYCGRTYPSLADCVNRLATGTDEIAKQFLRSGMLVFYLRRNDYEAAEVDKLESLIKRDGCRDTASVATICFALQGKKSFTVSGVSVDSFDTLIPVISRLSLREIDALLHDDHFIAWCNRLGYEKEMRRMKEAYR